MGSYVYVFNLYSEPVLSLTVNGALAGAIAGCGTGAGVPPYTPARLAVSRARLSTGSAAFVPGPNHLQIRLETLHSTGTVTIPSPDTSPVGPDDSLVLLLAVNASMLLTTEAQLLELFRLDPRLPELQTVPVGKVAEPA